MPLLAAPVPAGRVLADSVLGVDAYALQRGAIAILALVTILLLCRFTFGTGRRDVAGPPDFGLLVSVASMPTRAAAEIARDRLTRVGIRATLSDRPAVAEPVRISADGRELPRLPPGTMTYLLVFPADADRAKTLLAS